MRRFILFLPFMLLCHQAVAADIGSIAVLPLKAKGKARHEIAETLDDVVSASLTQQLHGRYRIITKQDIDIMLGFEKTRDILGCEQVSCAIEMAGALGVDSLITGTLGLLGQKYFITLTWIDERKAAVIGRTSQELGKDEEMFNVAVDSTIRALLKQANSEPAGLGNATEAAPTTDCALNNPQPCQRQCDNGILSGCKLLGDFLSRASDDSKGDWRRAAVLYEKACGAGYSPACGALGYVVLRGRGVLQSASYAVHLLENACTAQDADACYNLAGCYQGGVGVSADAARALQLFKDACAHAHAQACITAGDLLAKQNGTAIMSAAAHYRQACASSNALACTRLGELVRTRMEGSDAQGYLQVACDGNDAASCTRLALLLWSNEKTPTFPRIEALLQHGCGPLVLDPQACDGLGRLLATPSNPHYNLVKAACHFETACTLGNAASCDLGARAFLATASPDRVRAGTLLRKGCELGSRSACWRMGHLLQGLSNPPEEAAAFFSKACGHKSGCFETPLGQGDDFLDADCAQKKRGACAAAALRDLIDGRRPGSAAHAVEVLSNTCRDGVASSCVDVSTIYFLGIDGYDNAQNALRNYEALCERGITRACTMLAGLYAHGVGVSRNVARAKQLYNEACSDQDAESCQALRPER